MFMVIIPPENTEPSQSLYQEAAVPPSSQWVSQDQIRHIYVHCDIIL